MFTIPEMPLVALAWYDAADIDPPGPADAELPISLSPITTGDFMRAEVRQGSWFVSHIIRTLTNLRIRDSSVLGQPDNIFPATVWEFPPGSGKRYFTVWAHIVGSGFANAHSRVYVARSVWAAPGQPVTYPGWV